MRGLIAEFLLCVCAFPIATSAFAREATPDAVLNAAVAEAMCGVRDSGETAAAGAANTSGLVETEVALLFDFPRMTQMALARNWHRASVVQQALLIAHFKALLLRKHLEAFSEARKRLIGFKPLGASGGDTEARVGPGPKLAGSGSLRIAYDLGMTPAGWKVYDIRVGGASLIAVYRDSFARAVRDGGIEGLIESLSDTGRWADAPAAPAKATFRDHAIILFAMLQSALQGRR